MDDEDQASLTRLRLLYSLGDFQMALSASTFLLDCEPDEPISKKELRRFKCYETAMIVSYMRPFSQSLGRVPKLTLEMCGAPLRSDLQAIHEKMRLLRNRAYAHSDEQRMRMNVAPFDIPLPEGQSIKYIQTAFHEGIEFLDAELWAARELIRTVYNGIHLKLLEEAQLNPQLYRLRKSFLDEMSSDD